jgi:hypothetical protein
MSSTISPSERSLIRERTIPPKRTARRDIDTSRHEFHTLAMRFVVLAIILGSLGALRAQNPEAAFGQAVRRSLEKSRALYPDALVPGSPLCQAIVFRIEWLTRNNPDFFSDPDWPVKIAATEASRLGVRVQAAPASPSTADAAGRRYLGVVTKNFSVTGASFRKGQQVIIESLLDYGKRGLIYVDGQEIVLWLDHIKLLRELAPGAAVPQVVKIVSARYGLPGTKGYVVSSAVQSALTTNAQGAAELVVSDSLLPAAAAQRLNRSAGSQTIIDPATGQRMLVPGSKVLSVTYEIGGLEKTRQAQEGSVMVLD